ncbi:hypothetical protein [Larkinella soli]|uniref:hypothetical protein n=1 Tax=Larkinella soli TaxID=1770527 RepID=UPI000FFC7159|nr:hypothetical protein [Larkinella soli]
MADSVSLAGPTNRRHPVGMLVGAGLLAGVLDALAAVVFVVLSGRSNPVRLFQFIASGVFGPAAFEGGGLMVFCGLVFHFLIAFAWTLFFYFLYPRVRFISRNIALTIVLYGLFIWVIMNRVVLPLSNTPEVPFRILQAGIGMLILIFFVSLPIVFLVHRYYDKR